MKKNKTEKERAAQHRHAVHDAEGVASGAVAGAVIGAAGGPPGIVAGAVIGAIAGGIAAVALDNAADRQEVRDEELDEEIGVIGGDLGAPNLKHPPARVGAYSVAASGAGTPSSGAPAEGPIQPPDE